ncbi:MAG: hypothetical protein AB7O67_09240 [Vicinamibacterales bacterium]
MIELFVLGMLAVGGLAIAAVVGVTLFLVKLLVWTVLLPIRILFKLLWIPIGLALGAVGLAAGAVALPVVLLVLGGIAVVGLVIALLGLVLPLVPFLLLGLFIWTMVKKRPVAAA